MSNIIKVPKEKQFENLIKYYLYLKEINYFPKTHIIDYIQKP